MKVLTTQRLGLFLGLITCASAPAWATDLMQLTVQGKGFTLTASTTVSYGANNVFTQKNLQPGNYSCDDGFFGDPLWGVVKACYMPNSASAANSAASAGLQALVRQDGSFTLAKTTVVSYGANNAFNRKTLAAGTYGCTDGFFGDPIWGVVKACYAPADSAVMTKIVGQSSSFRLATASVVSYGANGVFVKKTLQPGTYACDDGFFGDPLWGVVKACYTTSGDTGSTVVAAPTPVQAPVSKPVLSATAPVTSPAPVTPSGTVAAISGDVMVNGAVSNAEYQAMARQMGTEASIAYRYGPSSAEYGTASQGGLPTYAKRASQSFNMISIQNPNGQGNRGCGWTSWCGNWQVGGALEYYWGDYSSNIMNFAYIADATPEASFFQRSYAPGVGSIQTFNMGHNTSSIEPEVSWTSYEGAPSDGGTIDSNIERYIGRRGGFANPVTLEKPVALAKCYGRGGWCTNSLAVYADGRIVGVGSNTSHNLFTTQLPAGKVPTALTITNSGEFALVTVWDTAAMRGQIAVLALGDGCQGCSPANEGSAWYANWGNWKRTYPGAPGLGNYNYAKLIGFVDLPDTLKAPTEISASTGLFWRDYENVQNFWNTDLDNPSVRARYASGNLSNAYARAGMAVVISKSEKRAAFVDLRPLFAYYKQQYFVQPQSDFNAMIANRGDGPSQWPYTFDAAPAQKPGVIKVVDLPNRPTAVRLSLSAPHRAYIATQEGKLRVFDLGTGYLNQAGGGSPSDIAEKFAVDVGRNPTHLGYLKEHATGNNSSVKTIFPNTPQREILVTSRGDRKVQWVRFDNDIASGSVVRTFQESRVIDPIATEDGENHGTESYMVSIADYAGKGIHSFLYGPIIWHTYDSSKACAPAKGGCQMLNGAPYEYGGTFKVPGKPFHAALANIN